MDGLISYFGRQYGFIRPLIGRPDAAPVFVHRFQCPDGQPLPVGARVSFVLVRGKDGKPQAARVRLRTLSGARLAKTSKPRNVSRTFPS